MAQFNISIPVRGVEQATKKVGGFRMVVQAPGRQTSISMAEVLKSMLVGMTQKQIEEEQKRRRRYSIPLREMLGRQRQSDQRRTSIPLREMRE